MRSKLVAGSLVALALTACGSTVQVRSEGAVGGDGLGGSGLGGTAAPVDGGSTGAVAPVDGGSTSAPGSTGGGTTGTTGGTGTTTVTPIASAPPAVVGAAKKSPVEVGVVIYPDVGAAAEALGASADVGDQRAEAMAGISWVNAHGGLNGHAIKPVFYEVSLTSTDTYASTYQKICSTFTQDHNVVASVFIGNGENALPACLTKRGGLYLAHGHYLHTAEDYRKLPLMVTTEDAGSDRIARAIVDEIVSKSMLKSGDTLGLMVMDYDGPNKARDSIIVPALKARGIKVLSYSVGYPQSTPGIANSVSAVQSAELAMASRGVKLVTFLCPGCFTFFLQSAENQGYYPRYLATSLDGLMTVASKGHERSLTNAAAVGWDPIKDVGAYKDAGLLAGNKTFNLCRQVEKANITGNDSLYASLAMCGAFQDLYAAAAANPTDVVTGASLMKGFTKLGRTHEGASNLDTFLGPNQLDGVSAYRAMSYVTSCSCFRYVGGQKAFR